MVNLLTLKLITFTLEIFMWISLQCTITGYRLQCRDVHDVHMAPSYNLPFTQNLIIQNLRVKMSGEQVIDWFTDLLLLHSGYTLICSTVNKTMKKIPSIPCILMFCFLIFLSSVLCRFWVLQRTNLNCSIESNLWHNVTITYLW